MRGGVLSIKVPRNMERLIEKQTEGMQKKGGSRGGDNRDKKEQEKLEKYKMSKMVVERIPVRHVYQSIGDPIDEVEIEEPEEENQITRTTLLDICNGLNELIRLAAHGWNMG